MKTHFIILILVSLLILTGLFTYFFIFDTILPSCTKEAKICPDGTGVGRIGANCEFEECPSLTYCDAENTCPQGFDCYKMPDNESPYCYIQDINPCFKCESKKCAIAESYPLQVICE